MTSQNHSDTIQFANSNVIKIPYSDNQEESFENTSLHINGFKVIELDENRKDYANLIPSYEEDQNIGNKEESQLKAKAEIVENHYSNCKDDKVPNVNCSKCLMNDFYWNELLYFKDRKTLISYLKYCFVFLKKNLFMNHLIYHNNKFDLFKVNSSFYNGWKFTIPKTICKACFIQMINMEYLLDNLKNIICDYYGDITSSSNIKKKFAPLLNNKRKRISTKKKLPQNDEKVKENNAKINPIVISIPESEKIKKKKNYRNGSFRRRRIKTMKKRNQIKSRYNKNVIYDEKNNTLTIDKKILGNYREEDDSLIINSIINDIKKTNANKDKDKEKEKEKEKIITKATKKEEEKVKLRLNNKTEMESLSNKKTVKKDKKIENVSKENKKDIDSKIKMSLLNKNNAQPNFDMNTSNTIIINHINNNKNREVNVNKVGYIHINSNKFENNINLDNYDYSNENYIINNNLKQNNNNILINNLNNNNLSQLNINNNFNTNYLTNAITQLNNFFSLKQNISQKLVLDKIKFYMQRINSFISSVKESFSNYSIGESLNVDATGFLYLVEELINLKNNYEDLSTRIIISINYIKYCLELYRAIYGENINIIKINDFLVLEKQFLFLLSQDLLLHYIHFLIYIQVHQTGGLRQPQLLSLPSQYSYHEIFVWLLQVLSVLYLLQIASFRHM